ncbi:amino acid adenylation domain-containing protein [Roseixanthobacter glucoisosaccharinicivorans]|uniref:amino acid adenylation domain-containing protein n=1 Tax=Roseixanthobacter glucoisosaccharinicivorans TaxID=3119923 RepID=UPI00372B62F5
MKSHQDAITLSHALASSAATAGGITYFGASRGASFLSYAGLRARALRWLHRLGEAGVRPGDEVLIATDDTELFTALFWACILGRIIAVPVSTPTGDEGALKIGHIWSVLHRPWLVGDARVAGRVRAVADQLDAATAAALGRIEARSLVADSAQIEGPEAPQAEVGPDDIAFVQFSSGSTGAPKGVMVTHANLLTNCAAILGAIDHPGAPPRFVSWMPLTHDFGIIWFHILPTVFGLDHGLIPTKLFVRNPLVWMQAASDLKANVTGGPNFSYRHFLKYFEPDAPRDWDLSNLRVIANGAEPIACALGMEFSRALAPFKLPQAALTPAYGLAEGTLVVSMAPPDEAMCSVVVDRAQVSPGQPVREIDGTEPGVSPVDFADIGRPIADVAVRIADDDGAELAQGVVGRIQIRGASVTRGYYNNEAATRAAFTADGWLDTGDLGFLRNHRLIVTGRRKDVIILNGANFYPQDIERVASAVEGLDLNMVVACAIGREVTGDDREHVALFVLHRRDAESFAPIAAGVRDAVLREIGIPVDYVLPVARIPKTTSGKVQRYQLVQRFVAGEFREVRADLEAREAADAAELAAAFAAGDEAAFAAQLRALARRIVEGGEIALDRPLMESGFTSLRLVEFARRLTLALGVRVQVTFLFEHATLAAIASALLALARADAREAAPAGDGATAAPPSPLPVSVPRIAVSGLALRLPGGVETPDAFRDLLLAGRDATGGKPAGRWGELPAGLCITERGGYLTDIETFPARFFNLTPAEAEAVDPQQRLLLMTAWEALERAGLDPTALKGSRTGVFVGVSAGDYVQAQARAGRLDAIGPYAFTGTIPSVAAGRLAYVLGLQGPVLSVDTACSSSLAALHLAVRALRAGECTRAIVAGVNLILSPDLQVGLTRMNALSADGRCKSFDAAADGYGRGEGCVALVLEAESARPARVLAYVRGSAINHDGASNGLTAPNGAAQRAVIAEALADAGLAPADVDYVEAHGTGTPLGDPIEAMALADAYGRGRAAPLKIGSVKTNIGHLEAAAGLAGLAKLLVALGARTLPASLHLNTPNPLIPWAELPLAPITAATPWHSATGAPLRAGLSSFGMSGTNAHVVIEEAEEGPEEAAPVTARPTILPLSARTAEDLALLAARYADALEGADIARLHDLARTAACARAPFEHRFAISGTSTDVFVDALRAATSRRREGAKAPSLVFLLPGQGAHAPETVRHLFAAEPAFRAALLEADAALAGVLDRPLSEILLGEDAHLLAQTRYNQPGAVALALAGAALLRSFGLEPAVVLGHSAGEIAAAAIGGLIAPNAALRFAAARGAAMDRLPSGAMAAVEAEPALIAEILADLSECVCVGAWNGAARATLSGTHEGIALAGVRFKARGCRVTPLSVSHAFHSPMMDGALEAIGAAAAPLAPGTPACRVVSSLTGALLRPGDLADGAHWVRHARQPVAFAAALSCAIEAAGAEGEPILLDLGVRPVLAPLAAAAMPSARVLSCFDARQGEGALLRLVGTLFELGQPIAWPAVFAGRAGRIADAPTSPFTGRTRVLPTRHDMGPMAQIEAGRAPETASHATGGTVSPVRALPRAAVAGTIRTILRGIAGLAPQDVEGGTSWFSLGLDSLLVVQLQQALAREYDIDLPLAEVMERGDTLDTLTDLVLERAAPPVEAAPAPADAPSPAPSLHAVAALAPQSPAASASALAPPVAEGASGLMALQIEAMSRLFTQQLAALGACPAAPLPARAASAPTARPVANTAAASAPAAPPPAAKQEVKGLFKADRSQRRELGAVNAAHVHRLAQAYNARTGASKAHTAAHRDVYANPRAVIGFRPEWKELNYPLHVERAEGPFVFDMDGHRYVDITMGFGVTLFGHNPPFVRDALLAEIAAGYPIGPQTPRAGRVARKIQDMTGAERVAFFTTGTEAVMVALRLARAKTGRRKIVTFVNSYHGTFDGVLAVGWADGEKVNTMPVSDGTPEGMVEDVIVLRYGEDDALDILARHADSLAAVLVEPVQSRDPVVQPRAFLHRLRDLTKAHGVALIFDETITGFRVHPAGAQHHFRVKADIVTYGKVVGGGLPIGVVTGTAQYLDAVDGGNWLYGDDSVPTARTAFVAGTFNNHPLTMAAAEATLDYLAAEGATLQDALNARTKAMCDELNAWFTAEDLPIRMVHFSSLFRFDYGGDTEILNYHLLKNGVFVWEGRNCFLSTAHGEAEVRFLIDAVKLGIAEMRAGGWLPPRDPAPPPAGPQPGAFPLGRGQREMRALIAADPQASLAYNEMIALDLSGPLDPAALERAFAALVARHDALRIVRLDEARCHFSSTAAAAFTCEDMASAGVRARLERDLATAFDLSRGPLVRALLLRLSGERHVFAFTAHHIVADGWSLGLMASELAALYGAEVSGVPVELPPARSFGDFVAWTRGVPHAVGEMPSAVPVALPRIDAADDGRVHLKADRVRGADIFEDAKAYARRKGVSPFMVMLAAYALLLCRLGNQRRLTIGVPLAGHTTAGLPVMVGAASAIMPVTLDLDAAVPFDTLVGQVRAALNRAQHEAAQLLSDEVPAEGISVNVLFNLDRGFELSLPGLALDWISPPVRHAKKDLFLNLLELNGETLIDFDHAGTVADAPTARRWLDSFLSLLAEGVRAPQTALSDLPLSSADRAAQGAADINGRATFDVFDRPAAIGVAAPLAARAAGGAWMRTGELGVLAADGRLAILGREEDFAFTRSGPVDLRPVAQVLREHPALADAALVREGEGLTAVVVGHAGAAPDFAALAAYCALRLPVERRPDAFLACPALPLGEDGTPDRAALAALPGARVPARLMVAPRTSEEQVIAGIWATVLGLKQVGVTESFFDLGGHSLKALAILARVEAALGRAVPLRAFFEQPTVAGLAANLSSGAAHAPIAPLPLAADYAPAKVQAGLWMLEQMDPGLIAYNIGFVLHAAHAFDEAALTRALTRLAVRHESLRTALVEVDGLPRQVIFPTPRLDLRVEAAAHLSPEMRDGVLRDFASAPFALDRAPLWRALLLRGEHADAQAGGEALAFTLHHIISDVWSVGVFTRDLLALLAEESGGVPAALPALDVQYKDCIAVPRADAEAHLAYWRAQLSGAPVLELPADAPRPPRKTHDGDHVVQLIPAADAAALKALAAARGASAFTAVAAAFQALLCGITGARDLVIGTVTAGRDHPVTADQIGFFVNTLALRGRVDPDQGFAALLDGTRDALLAAAAHGTVPFDRVVEALGAPRDAARNPLFEVVLVMDDRDEISRLLRGTGMTLDEVDIPAAQFDLTLYVTDGPDGLRIKATYNTRLFARARVAGWMALLADLVRAVCADARAPLAGILGEGGTGSGGTSFALPSFHQERLWFVDRFERGVLYPAGPTYYNMPVIARIDGGLETARLERAAQRLVARHEILRMALATREERPALDIRVEARLPITEIEVSPGAGLTALEEASRQSFALDTAPLARLTLCRERNGGTNFTATWLALTAHHGIADKASLHKLMGELAELYAAPDGAMPPAGAFSREIAAPERAAEASHGAAAAHWRARMEGLAALVLPTDRPRAAIHTYTADRAAGWVDGATLARLDAFAASEGLSRRDVLRACYQALLHRLCDQGDIIIGEPLEPAGVLAALGPRTNLLPLRVSVDPGESFAAFARRSAARAAEDATHGAMPFDLAVLAVKPKNDMSRTALFDVLFHYDTAHGNPAPGWQAADTGLGWGKYDLVLSLTADADGLATSLVFNRDLFDAATGADMSERYVRLVSAAMAAPGSALSTLDIMLPGERAALLARAADVADFPADVTLVSVFEAVAGAHAARIAASDAAGALTYEALNARANRIAHALIAHGVAADELVGLLVGRTLAIPTGILGILKAGGAYLPIDPAYPEDRIRFMTGDSGLRLIVADAAHAALARSLGAQVLVIEDVTIAGGAMVSANPAPRARPQDLAYVIYTSGSTGRPKGCMIEHRNVIQLFFHRGRQFDFGPQDVWTLFHSACFDFSTWELYGALLFGGRVVVVPQELTREPGAFLDLLAREGVSVLSQTPTAFYALTDAACAREALPLRLREIVFGGEALLPARLAPWRALYPQARLVNMYGITETTVHVTFKEIGAEEIADGRSVIGAPLPSYGVVLVGPDLALRPRGLTGEILVSGHGVARGYLNRPDLTADRFISHPDLPGQRLYRSGDLGRIGADGALLYLGRMDDQVKIRGFRIELGEIERQLIAHPGIRDAAVMPEGGDRADSRGESLTAYIVPHANAEGAALGREALFHHLADKLPDYMIPARFIRVAAIPLTANGKADRRALRAEGGAPLGAQGAAQGQGAAALTPFQQAVADIWCEVLDLPAVALEDNFFELGGHSLKANQAVVRLRQRLGASLDLRDFFSSQTLGVLVELIAGRAGAVVPPPNALLPAAEAADYPLSFAQRRLFMVQALDPSTVTYNMVGALRLDGVVDFDALARAFTALVARHEILRTRFLTRGGVPRQEVRAAGPDQLFLARGAGGEDEIARRLQEEFHHVFDLAAGPLLRVHLLADPARTGGAILINIHHIVCDGWSVNVMLRDLEALYRAALHSPRAPAIDLPGLSDLPPLELQYKDYAVWQSGQELGAAARAYWLGRFEEGAPVLHLPTDHARPARPSGAGRIVPAIMDDVLTAGLNGLARRADTSLFVLLTALVRLHLALLSGDEDIVIGTPVAGRDRLELEPQVGFYLNMLALRGQVREGAAFADLLAAERALVLDAFAHQAFPFDALVEAVGPAEEEGRAPLFDVVVILQNNDPVRLDLGAATGVALRDASVSAKYDLNFMFEEKPHLELLLEYSSDVFDAETVEAMAADFVRLARAVTAAPQALLGDLRTVLEPPEPQPETSEPAAPATGLLDQPDAW